MKKKVILVSITTGILFLISCHKIDFRDFFHKGKKEPFLKELMHGSRRYVFYYDRAGFIDSIRAIYPGSGYVYRVVHRGKKIDSVSLVQNGTLVSTNGDIEYDHKGRITGFTYYLRIVPAAPARYTITYEGGNIRTITERRSPSSANFDTLTFNSQNNLVQWLQTISHTPVLVTTFTYDEGLNPLYFIDNLFVMFTEEHFIWEFVFSEHNSTGKTRTTSTVDHWEYINEYDRHGRLSKKLMLQGSRRDSLVYRYIH
jgi:hypothetical protein